jgi:hypothetical protein
LDRIAEIASDQWGLITRRQAERARVPATTIDRLTAPEGRLARIAFGVYQLKGTPIPDHSDLRAAWLQLAPAMLVWERSAVQGVVSHRSAAALYGVGHLPADVHEFTFTSRRQTRRPDVRIHVRGLTEDEVVVLGGLPVTRPARIAEDLIREREDPEAVAQIIVEALRGGFEYPKTFSQTLRPYAARFGFGHGEGLALLNWLFDVAAVPESERWVAEARAYDEDIHASSAAAVPAVFGS